MTDANGQALAYMYFENEAQRHCWFRFPATKEGGLTKTALASGGRCLRCIRVGRHRNFVALLGRLYLLSEADRVPALMLACWSAVHA